jgi:sugar-specific transcriptional regulator TrmB
MSHEWMLKTLVSLGLSQVEAEVYLFLTLAGLSRGREIAGALRLYKQQLYRTLKSLKCKGCVEASREHPAKFSAVLLEKVFDHFMKAKTKQAEGLQASREELLSNWRSMIENNSSTN